jgi:transglutaminase-like putative cysteine protease
MGGEKNDVGGRRFGAVGIVICSLVAVVLLASAIPALSVPVDYLNFNDTNATIGSGPNTADPATDASGTGSGEPRIGGDPDGSDGTHLEKRFADPPPNRTSTETVHFTVRAEAPAYWRLTAYDTYLQDGWRRSDRPPAWSPDPPNTSRTLLSQEVTLRIPAVVLPAAWRPVDVSNASDTDAAVGPASGVVLDGTASPNETFVVTSIRPETDPAVGAGEDYPDELEERYTALPASVPDRVVSRTESVTTDADSPYETAVAVEQWFRSNYEFRMNRSAVENDTAAEVLFEREAAHSSLIATTMTVMLRTEGVPARYVKGYTPGVPNETNDTFVVRTVHQHAWVEVYFPEAGWVPFDPTPGGDRRALVGERTDTESGLRYLDYGNRSLRVDGNKSRASNSARDEEGAQAGSDGADSDKPREESDGSSESSSGVGNAESEGDGGGGSSAGRSSSSQDARGGWNPGPQHREFQLELLDDPVPEQPLRVRVVSNDEPVPGARIRFEGEPVGETNESGVVAGTVPFRASLNVTASAGGERPAGQDAPERIAARSVPLPTTIDVAVENDAYAGTDVALNATIEGYPVSEGDVSVADRLAARTNRSGLATVGLPETTGNVTLAVERGAASGERTVELPPITITTAARPAPLPGRPTTVTVEYDDGTPVSDATVLLGGERVASTDDRGTATISPGTAYETTVAATRGDWRVATTITPLRNLLAGGSALLALALLAGAVAKALGRAPLGVLRSASHAVAAKALVGLILLSRLVDLAWSTVVRAVTLPARDTRLTRVRDRLEALAATVAGVFGSSADTSGTAPREPAGPADDGPVRHAWGLLLGAAAVTRPVTETPREIANRAIAVGLPADAVETILETFRTVEYGDRDPDGSRLAAVRDAAELVRSDGE